MAVIYRAVRLSAVALTIAVFAAEGPATSPTSAHQDAADPQRILIATLIDRSDPGMLRLTAAERSELRELYQCAAEPALWLDASGRPDRNALDARLLLGSAETDGLDPLEYSTRELSRLDLALEGPGASEQARAAFDVALSAATLRFMRHLHLGRVDPRAVGFRLSLPGDHHDFAALLAAALANHRIREAADELRPQMAQYGALRTALARYRSLAARDTAVRESFAVPAAPIRPGDPYHTAPMYQRLVELGDLADNTVVASMRYDGVLVDGVRRFQQRHGLEADGVLGKATFAALRTPLAWRVRQIELALERLRWVRHLRSGRLIVVNIPMFRLWAADTSGAAPSLDMGVIVGRALRTQTPVFIEEMREVVFRPYWNVPASILRHEVLPAIQRDSAYLTRQNMEIVRGAGDAARAVAPTPENIAGLTRGQLRVRQRPGPRNSLGLIKFVFPNDENVYMHGTPAQELFSRARRDFSHGCVRIEDPVGLAEWALRDMRAWTRDRIVSTTLDTQTVSVRLTQPIQVILFYTTAVVMPGDRTIHFASDIYGHDARLDRALLTRRRAPAK